MSLFRDKKIIALTIILALFTILYFIAVNKISYAFLNDYNPHQTYSTTIETIKKCAVAYGKNNLGIFKEEKIIYIKVQDLIDNNFLIPDENGKILNPLKNDETLNSNIIKLKLENDEVIVEVDS